MQSDAMALLDEVLPSGENGVRNKINANSRRNIPSKLKISFKPL